MEAKQVVEQFSCMSAKHYFEVKRQHGSELDCASRTDPEATEEPFFVPVEQIDLSTFCFWNEDELC